MEICPACTVTLIVVGVVLVLAIIVAAVLAFWTCKAEAMVVVPTHVAAVEMPKPAVVPVQMCVGQAYLAAPCQHAAVQHHALHAVHAVQHVCVQAPPSPPPAPPPPPPSCGHIYLQPAPGSHGQICIQAPPGQPFVLRG